MVLSHHQQHTESISIMSRYEVSVKKAGFGAYHCTVIDRENIKPVMQCEIQNYNAAYSGSTPVRCQWRICLPKIIHTPEGDAVEFDGGDCMGFQTKKEAIESLKEDGLIWDGLDIHQLLVA